MAMGCACVPWWLPPRLLVRMLPQDCLLSSPLLALLLERLYEIQFLQAAQHIS
jgi:hypothetical protein